MSGADPDEPRETPGATTALVVAYVRKHGGDAAVADMLRRAGVPWSAAELSLPCRWTGYDTRIRLFTAATEALGDSAAMLRVGAEALRTGLNPTLVLLIRAMGSPRQVYRRLPRAVATFTTTSTMEVLDVGATHATIRYRLHEGYRHSRLDCDYVRGLVGTVPTVFGLPPATVVHEQCESDGAPACLYHVTWERRRRPWRRQGRAAVEQELAALRGQVQALQSAAGDLVASDDLSAVLRRIVERAAAAVLAPGYLLAVSAPHGGAPLVHAAGLPQDRVPLLARRLLAGEDLGPGVVVVDVASSRRRHGRLAALHRPGSDGPGGERDMLAAYAGHAAAALDLVMALDEARSEARRAGALLGLAHRLAAATDADAVCQVVADALPGIVPCGSAAVLLWEPAEGVLRTGAVAGLTPAAREEMLTTRLTAEDTPELIGMLTDREPRLLTATESSPVLRALLHALGVSDAVAVPLLAGTAFLGVVTACWSTGQPEELLRSDVLTRLGGVGDQASTALQNARLLQTVRHQASHDSLTGLPNRVLLLERLEGALAEVRADQHVALLFCDLDGFKDVNDSLGHAAGDELLRQVSARLRGAIRPGDTVSRLSGDEFAVVLPGLAVPGDAQHVVGRIRGCFTEPFRLERRPVAVEASVGVAVHSGEWGVAEQMLRAADAAMYRQKRSRRPGGAARRGDPAAG